MTETLKALDATERAIKIALENGYNRDRYISREHVLLDKEFFIALGKGLGWMDYGEQKEKLSYSNGTIWGWQAVWHRFIDHLAEGKSMDTFFTELIK